MLGYPRFRASDKVSFLWDGDPKDGIIEVVDKYGTFLDKSDVQYDIFNEEENMLYKHIPEKDIIKKKRKYKNK
jgi:hypothetical protein